MIRLRPARSGKYDRRGGPRHDLRMLSAPEGGPAGASDAPAGMPTPAHPFGPPYVFPAPPQAAPSPSLRLVSGGRGPAGEADAPAPVRAPRTPSEACLDAWERVQRPAGHDSLLPLLDAGIRALERRGLAPARIVAGATEYCALSGEFAAWAGERAHPIPSSVSYRGLPVVCVPGVGGLSVLPDNLSCVLYREQIAAAGAEAQSSRP